VKNKRKLNSHLWFFKGYCRLFQPRFCCMIDVGTIPHKEGIYTFYKALSENPNLGGVCGKMGVRYSDKPFESNLKRFLKLLIEGSQDFEYVMSHILDKAFESFFGFIHVLPGAWSAYNWQALDEHSLIDNYYLKSTRENYRSKTLNEV
jgi:chitin synthase